MERTVTAMNSHSTAVAFTIDLMALPLVTLDGGSNQVRAVLSRSLRSHQPRKSFLNDGSEAYTGTPECSFP